MGTDLQYIIGRFELIGFFSGYPIIYMLVLILSEAKFIKSKSFLKQILNLLPLAYATAGTLYLGLLIKNLYPSYTLKNIEQVFQADYLKLWGLLSLLCWIPLFRRNPAISFWHSLILFFFFLFDAFAQTGIFGSQHEAARNYMHVYQFSLLFHACMVLLLSAFYFLFQKMHSKK